MDEAQVKEVLDQLFLEARVPSVSFTGGEATIRKDLPELVHYAKNLGMRVNLITNGTLVSRSLAEELASSGLASAQVSLEGVTAETHEKLTRIRGSFRKTLAAVGHFQEARVRVHTNTTINRENLLECLEMPGFVKRELERPRFSMNLLIPTGSATLAGSLVVGYGEIGPYLAQILEASRKEEVEFMWYSPTPLCLFNPIAHQLGNKGCSACDGLISIAANGDVLPCSSYDDPVGNLLKENILAIWNSEKSCWYRNKKFAHQKCQSCVDFQVCHGACPIYWREQGFGELEFEFGNQPEKGEGKECFCQKPMNAV
jgi:radical SAM protein with 4Fe4S-binding SPASM domain